jgi:hypothetical protein
MSKETELWSKTADTEPQRHYVVDASKIETIADIAAIIAAMDLHVPSNNEKFDDIKHLLKPVK